MTVNSMEVDVVTPKDNPNDMEVDENKPIAETEQDSVVKAEGGEIAEVAVTDEEGQKTKITKAILDEKDGSVEFRIVLNDGSDESSILLTGLKNIFQKQLPKMPKEYIGRLVYDRNHVSIAVVRHPLRVVGGISFRPFVSRKFAEIVFCAVASTEQVKGYGSRMMTHLKDYVREKMDIWHFLTYADNYAIGYFKKQGFTTEVTLDKSVWVGYIKDYEGGTIMHCAMLPKIKYLEAQEVIQTQRRAVYEKIREISKSHIVHPGLQAFKEGATSVPPESVPGLKEAGWTPEMMQLYIFPLLIGRAMQNQAKKRGPLYALMKRLVQDMQDHSQSWPFAQPVAGVPDYYDVIKDPMDLQTLGERVEADAYTSVDDFAKDVQKIFDNCKTYNEDGTTYVRCANKLEKYFKERLEALRIEMGL